MASQRAAGKGTCESLDAFTACKFLLINLRGSNSASTHDALLLFEAARRGHIPKIRRRLKDEERKHLIRSGAVFVFEEKESGIKRWTDGLLWSPSRILQNFLVSKRDRRSHLPSMF